MLVGLVLVLGAVGGSWGLPGVRDHRQVARNVTRLLDDLLAMDRYDKRIRPDFGGPPVKITVNMYIKSIGPVSETDEWYALDCYFRQRWYDSRLRFNLTGLDEFSMNWLFLERVWKPDTFFMNGKKSYLHRITVPNKFLRIRSDGFLTYSMRLTIKASCKMHLRKFPLDSQTCPLLIGSYGYDNKDVTYEWVPSEPVGLEAGVSLAQYDLVNITTDSEPTKEQVRVQRSGFSVIRVQFYLKRMTGYFMLQVYVPCALIVSCSWVSFWIDPDAVPARVSLGVTTVLSMTTMGFGGRAQMPKVSYRTALDWFVILCFSFVFAVMVEYAAINFIDTLTADLKKIIAERKKQAQIKKEEPPPVLVMAALVTGPLAAAVAVGAVGDLESPAEAAPLAAAEGEEEEEEKGAEEEEGDEEAEEGVRRRGRAEWIECACTPVRKIREIHLLPTEEQVAAAEGKQKEKFSQIDINSRKIFPCAFIILFSAYWILYMYYITDEVFHDET